MSLLAPVFAFVTLLEPLAPTPKEPTKEELIAFDGGLVALRERLAVKRAALDKILEPALNDQCQERLHLKGGLADTLIEIKKIKAETKSLQVPPSEAAKRYRKAFDNYLTEHEEQLLNGVLGMIEVMEDRKLEWGKKQSAVLEMIKVATAKEAALARTLAIAQNHYFKEHGVAPMRDKD